mmetsp:Transcript_36904/g.44097  ORF Transcript_36904/g.44097 Transcript_36904/m.44097 type:complete len:106 (+) Transcript_36904:76-393(+)|eukprot:CAMPEP_0198249940 /NCGR_PEP_ID=MMETSP1447-20131203/1300_1 /TAXON_ID=420782 /ORGANISM="Chaetoceros dichaeta, Strain CCMP1751" /LENGTH=105 /DNA_ID=CAMNT_0043934685 /DNA_START=71 /DNA_END=391 /DNA_ORIENTATION=+
MVQQIKTVEEFNKILADNNDKLVVVDYTATWCPPCKQIAPIYVKIADENPEALFIKVDVDEGGDIASEQGISAMPTFQFWKNGELVHTFSGASEEIIRTKVAELK